VREVCLAAYDHQDVPFEKLVVALQSERDLSRSPLFQVKIELGESLMNELELPDLKWSPIATGVEVVRYDLHLFLTEQEQTVKATMVYATDLFDAKTINTMNRQLEMLLLMVIEEPDARLSDLEEKLAEAEKKNQTRRERKVKETRLAKYKEVKRVAINRTEGSQPITIT
jgi:non-ribosomal peptide synthetase component F